MITILAVNVGSTSLKFKWLGFDAARPDHLETLADGRLEGIGRPKSVYKIVVGDRVDQGETSFPDYESALRLALEKLAAGTPAGAGAAAGGAGGGLAGINAVCFKPVHARDVPRSLTEMTERILDRMADYNGVAPAHNPPVIAAVGSFRAMMPTTPMLGLFEPAFYNDLAPEVYAETVPYEWIEEFGIRKYGFHGASHRFISERAPEFLDAPAEGLRLISCHLGGSSSITAIRCGSGGGRALDTTMSFSPQSGLPQGARCGSIDPFIPIFLIQSADWSVEAVSDALAKRSGLLGLSGVSAEFREIEHAAAEGNERAKLAVDVFVYRAQGEIARLTVPLGGLDALVFTGGIGERSPETRARICAGLGHLGVKLDPALNAAAKGDEARLEAGGSGVKIAAIPTNEELILAREAAAWLAAAR